MRVSGKAVRSRIVSRMSKSASAPAAIVLGTESVGEERKIGATGESGPVGAASRHVLPIVEDRNFYHFFSGTFGFRFTKS